MDRAKRILNYSLINCFMDLVDKKSVDLDLDDLKIMLIKQNIRLPLDILEPDLLNILPYLLFYSIQTWPGWSKSVNHSSGSSGTFPLDSWSAFYEFVYTKLQEVMIIHHKQLDDDELKLEIDEIMRKYNLKDIYESDITASQSMIPFTIEFTANTDMLNTIVFKQIITWPYVGMHLKTPIFTITRKNLQYCVLKPSLPHADLMNINPDFVSSTKLVNPTMYKIDYFLPYINMFKEKFLEALKHVFIDPAILESFKIVMNEFINDIIELDVRSHGYPSIATNTAVLFNIGKCTYQRNKMNLCAYNKNNMDIDYTELIEPQMEIRFTMKSVEDNNKYIHFLQNYQNDNSQAFKIPQISFCCTFCKLDFRNERHIVTHLKNEHKMEQPMMCIRCKQQFDVFDLTMRRWTHNNCESRVN